MAYNLVTAFVLHGAKEFSSVALAKKKKNWAAAQLS